MMVWLKVNPIGTIFAACSYILIGIFFYSRWVLGKFWPDLVKHMQKQADSVTTKVYLGAFVSALVIAYVMGCFVNLVQVKNITSGVLVGFLVWVGFILPTIFAPVLFGKKPLEMFWLDAVYYLIAYIVMGTITAKFNL